jgi:hypothetical protein
VKKMSMTIKRNFAISILLALLVMFCMAFVTPVVSHAASANPNDVSVKLTPDASGKMGLAVTGGGFTNGGSAGAWEAFIGKYRNFITGIAGIGAVTMVVLFIVQFMKLGASAGNPQARSQALVGVLWTGIAAAGLGAVTLIVGFFYNAVG